MHVWVSELVSVTSTNVDARLAGQRDCPFRLIWAGSGQDLGGRVAPDGKMTTAVIQEFALTFLRIMWVAPYH